MLFRRYAKDAYDAGYWDGIQDNPYKLNIAVNRKSYRAGYRKGAEVAAQRSMFANSSLSLPPSLPAPLPQ